MSASKFVHNLHSLSVVSNAWENVDSCIWIWLRRNKMLKQVKLVCKSLRSIGKIQMKVGSSNCDKKVFLAGLEQYSDAYATGALWP